MPNAIFTPALYARAKVARIKGPIWAAFGCTSADHVATASAGTGTGAVEGGLRGIHHTKAALPGRDDKADTRSRVANHAGFSLHAGVMAEAHQRDKLERLCRYISRPAISEKRLVLTTNGQVRYELKTPYRNGTTHVIFEPLDFMAGRPHHSGKEKLLFTAIAHGAGANHR